MPVLETTANTATGVQPLSKDNGGRGGAPSDTPQAASPGAGGGMAQLGMDAGGRGNPPSTSTDGREPADGGESMIPGGGQSQAGAAYPQGASSRSGRPTDTSR